MRRDKMQLKDVTPIIKEILEERDKNPLVNNTERYIPCYRPNEYGNAVRAGLRKALRAIEQAPVVKIVHCKDCWRRGNPDECPMCHDEWFYDEDDGDDFVRQDNTEDNGYCNCGQREKDL
jgi:hypothetical protein